MDEVDVADVYRKSYVAGRVIASKTSLQCNTTPLGRLDLSGNLQGTIVRNLPFGAVDITVQNLS